jgi:hypothetical protein
MTSREGRPPDLSTWSEQGQELSILAEEESEKGKQWDVPSGGWTLNISSLVIGHWFDWD